MGGRVDGETARRVMKPRLLDLFCGAGGATHGYQLAGFHVTGVDLVASPNYCGDEFVQADALTFPLDGFDVIHASPPCQDHSSLVSVHGPHGTGWMLQAMLDRLRPRREPWVVENVVGSGLLTQPSFDGESGVLLCGASFGLGALGYDLARHRLFQSNLILSGPACICRKGFTMGVEGHGAQGHEYRRPGPTPILADRAAAMGIDWMNRDELSQAIPPAYTEFIGAQLLSAISEQAA